MANFEFKVKRGMVFYMEEPSRQQPYIVNKSSTMPQKKRPYIVLSNNACNEHGSCIHVAPLFSRDESGKPYHVFFVSGNGHHSIIDIGSIMLVPKALCTVANYSEAITRYTMTKDVLHRLSIAIAHQFDIDLVKPSDEQIETVEETHEVESPVVEVSKQNEPVIPQIHLTINLNGVPVNVGSVQTNESNAVIDANFEAPEQHEEIIQIEPEKPKKRVTGRHTKEAHNRAIVTVVMRHREFNGTMSTNKLSAETGMARETIRHIIKKMKEMRREPMSAEMTKEFVHDYETLSKDEMLEKYCLYGFTTIKKLNDTYRYHTAKKVRCR